MTMPEIDWKNLPGPKTINRITLPNKTTILSFSNFNVSSVFMVGLINCGSILDPTDKLGLAHFTSNMLTRGTTHRNFNAYHHELETRGASLTFDCGSNHTWFRGKALAEDIEILFDLASDSMQRPEFSPEYIERLRSQLLAGLAIRDQDTSEMASLIFDQTLFAGHPYGQPQDGFIQTIQAITHEDLLNFHLTNYSPSGMIIAIAGAVSASQVTRLVEKYLSKWHRSSEIEIQLPPVPEKPKGVVKRHKFIEGKSQVDLIMGTRGPTRVSSDYLPVYLGNNILGQFGLMGRIGESVRTRSGLAYHASSDINAWWDSGTWEFVAGTSPEHLDQTIDLIREEIKRFISEPVSQEELQDSQSHLIGRLPLSLESNAGLANAILTMERFKLRLDYYQRYADLLKSISAEQILEISRRYLDPEQLVIASAGPGEDI